MPGYTPMPRKYELMVLINPEVTEDALTAEIDQISALISGAEGTDIEVKRDTPWGRRRLAYQIQNFRDATYVLYHFSSAPARVLDLERELKLDERVIRYLVVRYEEPAEAPPVERPDRPERAERPERFERSERAERAR
ncbi:MAG TPA: 30S ribosomal protein S6 [Thermomicrobiaceae bacterium]|nr:30S ribosomal protein S6 [Thermomicrobiaceae bacterium]